jgi:hypothetical protein
MMGDNGRFGRHRIDPVMWMRKLGWPTDHITYDPKLRKGEYQIVRGSTHDGTLLFTHELLGKALEPLADKSSYYKPREAEFTADTWHKVRYVVGPLKLATVFGEVSLPCSDTMKYPGQRERVRIAVRMVMEP